MLEVLTSKQQAKMLEVCNFWKDYIFSCKNTTNKEQAKIGIEFIYGLAKLEQPQIIFVDSPMSCHIASVYLKEYLKALKQNNPTSVGASVGDSVKGSVGAVWASVRASVRASVWASVWASVGDSVRASVFDSVRGFVGGSVGASVESFSSYCNISDYGWVSFYDFFTQIGVLKNDNYNQFKSTLLSGIYDCIQLNGYCIVSNMPDRIERDEEGRMHCENNSAIHFRDGYELFYWHGVNIPKDWVINKKYITKETFLNEVNAEKRRCLQEIIGNKRLIKMIGVEIIDEDIETSKCNDTEKEQSFPIKLYRTIEKDNLINDYIYFLNVIDPSTKREYYLCVPESKNVWESKSWTFLNKKIEVRHGDIGMLNIKQEFEHPIYES